MEIDISGRPGWKNREKTSYAAEKIAVYVKKLSKPT